MTIKQLSVFLENREGRLDDVLKTLGENEVNIVALSLADTADYGMLRLIVSDPEKGKQVLKEAGGFREQPEKIISGGPMMGMALFDLNVPIGKTSSALLCLTRDNVAELEPSACIRCGRCVAACPSNLVPQKMMEYAEANNVEGFIGITGTQC